MGLWYYLLVTLLTTVDFPLELPVGDLSHLVPGASQRRSKIQNAADKTQTGA